MNPRSLALLAITSLTLPFEALAQPPLNENLFAPWALDSEIEVFSGIEGDFVGDPQFVSGVKGLAVDPQGSQYLRIEDNGDHPLDLNSPFIVSMWVNPRDLSSNQKLFSKDNVLEVEVTHAGTGGHSARISNVRRGRGSAPLVAGTWQHVVVSWNGTTVRYFLKGVPDGEATFEGTLRFNDRSIGLGARPAGYLDGMQDGSGIAWSDTSDDPIWSISWSFYARTSRNTFTMSSAVFNQGGLDHAG